jgi:hypothetical protein
LKHAMVLVLVTGLSFLSVVPDADAARRVVVRKSPRGTRVRVTTHRGFPIHRTLPQVVVRTPVVRVAPRVYLGPVAFTAAAISTLPPASARVWTSSETLEREDGWTDFTLNVDRRGRNMILEIDRGAAQISFAEVVFENGEAQVVDFDDRVHATGIYSLIDFKDGRKVDHVRIVAKADTRASVIQLHLVG